MSGDDCGSAFAVKDSYHKCGGMRSLVVVFPLGARKSRLDTARSPIDDVSAAEEKGEWKWF